LFPRHLVPTPRGVAEAIPGLERIWLDTPQGRVESWLLPGRGASPQNPGPAVIFAHGNAELIDHWASSLEPYRAMGVTVLLPEYRGYGRSGGSPSQKAITQDLVRLYDLLVARPEVDPARVVFHGRSLGGGAVCALAARRPPASMILQSTFTSVRELMANYLIPGFLVADPFDNLAVLRHLQAPVLVVHGHYDALIPHHHAQRLADACQGRLLSYPCDHNDCPPDWNLFWGEVRQHLQVML
jgi:fermentation-respiration switch protein FrsA (DUF1100 family)